MKVLMAVLAFGIVEAAPHGSYCGRTNDIVDLQVQFHQGTDEVTINGRVFNVPVKKCEREVFSFDEDSQELELAKTGEDSCMGKHMEMVNLLKLTKYDVADLVYKYDQATNRIEATTPEHWGDDANAKLELTECSPELLASLKPASEEETFKDEEEAFHKLLAQANQAEEKKASMVQLGETVTSKNLLSRQAEEDMPMTFEQGRHNIIEYLEKMEAQAKLEPLPEIPMLQPSSMMEMESEQNSGVDAMQEDLDALKEEEKEVEAIEQSYAKTSDDKEPASLLEVHHDQGSLDLTPTKEEELHDAAEDALLESKLTNLELAQAEEKDNAPKDTTNLEESQKFLKENMLKMNVITLDSGLQYKVIKAGNGPTHPEADTPCQIEYVGKLVDGTEFGSSFGKPGARHTGQPTYIVPNKVIKGWEEAMSLMVEGDKWEMYIPSELAFGEKGTAGWGMGKVPEDSALIVTVQMVKVGEGEEKAQFMNQLSDHMQLPK